MKNILIIFTLLLFSIDTMIAQQASDIMKQYAEVTGGEKNWNKIKSMKIRGTAKLISQGGMELPFLRIMKKDGRQITSLVVSGMDYVSIAYDGEMAWGSNQQLQAEAKDADVTYNTMISKHDFPYPGHHWKENGYSIKLLGEEMVEGIETYKIEITKKPQSVEGKEVENVMYLYVDTKKNIPILSESLVLVGPEKGKIMRSFLSNYKMVDGYLYPFTVKMKYGDDTFQILETEIVEWNTPIDDSIFTIKTN